MECFCVLKTVIAKTHWGGSCAREIVLASLNMATHLLHDKEREQIATQLAEHILQ